MKRLWALLLVFLLLLTGCMQMDFGEATPSETVYTTPNGTEFVVPSFTNEEESDLILSEAQITDELREKYLNFCQTYLVNKLPTFDYPAGVEVAYRDAMGYADIFLYNDYQWGYDEQGNEIATLSGHMMEEFVDRRFGRSLGLKQSDEVIYEKDRQSYYYEDEFAWRYPMVELTDYAEAKCGDATVIRIRGRGYFFGPIEGEYSKEREYTPRINKPLDWDSHIFWEMMKETGKTYYQCAEERIVTGQTEELNPPTAIIETVYMEGEDGEPLFLSYAATPVDQTEAHPPVEYIPEEE